MHGINGYGIFLLNILLATAVYCLNITKLTIPEYYVIEKGSETNNLVLDCEYDLDSKDSSRSLVIKWSLNDHHIYQWIPTKKPYVYPHMKDKIDATYEASTDPYQKHRALSLVNLSWNTTGEYKCSVQTFESLDSKSNYLQIIDLSQSDHKIQRNTDLDFVEIACVATNMFPRPAVNLSLNDEPLPVKFEKFDEHDNGFFDVSVSWKAKNTDFNAEDKIDCLYTFPKIDYNITDAELYSGGTRSGLLKSTTYLSLILPLLVSIFLTKSI